MTANHEYAPDTQEMLKKYIYQGGTLEEFYRWLDGVCMRYQQLGFSEGVDHATEGHADEIAAAEQRGAALGRAAGWDKAIESLHIHSHITTKIARWFLEDNPYRTDQEGDDD